MQDSQTTSADWIRQLFLLATALFQIFGGAASFAMGLGTDIGTRSNALDTPIIPSGWAFSIWGLIFLVSIIFAISSLLPKNARNAVVRRVSYPLGFAFAMNGFWEVYVSLFNIDWISLAIIAAGTLFALTALFRAGNPAELSLFERYIVRPPIALLAGWLTAATFVGTSSVMLLAGIEPTMVVLLSLLGGATLLGALMTGITGGWLYVAPLLWALSAVINKNMNGGDNIILTAASGAIAILLLARLFASRYRAF